MDNDDPAGRYQRASDRFQAALSSSDYNTALAELRIMRDLMEKAAGDDNPFRDFFDKAQRGVEKKLRDSTQE